MTGIHRLCAGDIGSNSIKVRVVETNGPLRRTLFESRYPIRLGASAFERGVLTDEDIRLTVGAFEEVAAVTRGFGVGMTRVVATSALREASNANELVEAVRRSTGFGIDVISGAEEAHLIARGLRPEMHPDAHNLVIDIGGGSTELIYTRTSLEADTLHSIRLGAVRLVQQIKPGDPPSKRELALLESAVEDGLERGHLPAVARRTHVIGVAGAIRAILEVKLAREAATDNGFTLKELDRIIRTVRTMTVARMQAAFGIDARRAQIFLAGAMVLRGILDLLGVGRVNVSGAGLRDGLIAQMMDELTGGVVHGPEALVRRIGEKYAFDAAHAEHVALLACQLFDQLAPLHGLEARHREHLRVAAMLHDIGQFVSYGRHHKHSHYLLMNEEIPGLLPADQQLVAALARYHRKAEPSEAHPEYALLPAPVREVLPRLAALLRIADGLDRQHRQLVTGLRASANGGDVEVVVESRLPVFLELSAAVKKSELFQKVFGRKINLRGAPECAHHAGEET